MRLVEHHIIKSNHSSYKELSHLCFLSKNLYNKALYEVRQHYFKAKEDPTIKYKYLNYYSINKLLKTSNDIDYRALPSNVSQETLKLVDKNFMSFFSLIKKKIKKVKLPKYLDKQGKQILVYNHNTLSKKYLDQNIIKIPKTNLIFTTTKKNIQQVRVVPKNGYIVLEVVYNVNEKELKQDNFKYLSIDLGMNNLATCTSNVVPSFIINGKPVKAINLFYNKTLGKLQSKLAKQNLFTSNKTKKLTLKRNNKINDYFHKASKHIINQAVSNSLNTIVIGYNKGWKQEINLGKKTNQKFVQIPFMKLIQLISYKAKLEGINVVTREESYTSKCSFLDNESICNHETYLGQRTKRGLFISSSGVRLNSDVNGSLNILRKHLNVACDELITPASIGLVVNPIKVNIKL